VHDAKMPREHAAIPLWGCEDLYWEDFEIGHRIRTIRRTISEGESMAFNTLVVDIHPYVADEIFAVEEGLFKRRLVAGAFVFSAGIGLVATNWLQAFSYGYDRLRFIKPVFIGDTIRSRLRVARKEDDPKLADYGRVIKQVEVLNQHGEVVMACEEISLVKRRPRAAE